GRVRLLHRRRNRRHHDHGQCDRQHRSQPAQASVRHLRVRAGAAGRAKRERNAEHAGSALPPRSVSGRMGRAGQLVSLWITLFSIFQVHAPWAASQTLQHIHWAGGYGQVYMDGLRDVISEFERSNPGVSIEVIVPAGNVAEYLAVQIAAGVSWDTATLMP